MFTPLAGEFWNQLSGPVKKHLTHFGTNFPSCVKLGRLTGNGQITFKLPTPPAAKRKGRGMKRPRSEEVGKKNFKTKMLKTD